MDPELADRLCTGRGYDTNGNGVAAPLQNDDISRDVIAGAVRSKSLAINAALVYWNTFAFCSIPICNT